MNTFRYLLVVLLLQATAISVTHAGEFAWFEGLAVEARADKDGFRARLATRFRIGDASVQAVIDQTDGRPADAYMVLRLGEMARLPVNTVLERYHANKDRGWGVLAKSIGIKPGSAQFHALKRGHDLHGQAGNKGGKGKGKAHKAGYKGKGNGKGGKG